ncbi:formate/nitrite transporter family protein [Sphingomonas ginsenosidivorax]|uniref:Formate/nitrite transporter family protein n=1 Tax=Sphingomonas ginsenosidivorax TaxID=862135 RepID=A0A5C6UJN4_9SPHN|nr:formate/nitrite transporter family protein [Sphingomonas ginsenosidivorax]TXC72481.1 formate/nitrite transporter family protein [Sphingomonas ginsenosidivorax]
MADPTPEHLPQDAAEDVDDLKAADAKDLHQAVREAGEEELDRPVASLFVSGLAGGLAISSSLVAEGALHAALPESPWRDLVVALGYPIGFLVVILGRMQLFTESTITAMLPLVTRPSGWALGRTLRLWAVVLVANLVGTAITGGAIAAGVLGSAELRDAMIAVSMAITELSPRATFVNAIPAGFMIAILAWSLPNARTQAFQVIVAITYVVAIGGFSHSIVGSVEAFLLLFSGHVGAVQTLAGLLLPAILGNLLGGAGIFALLAHGQVRGEMKEDTE